MYDALKGLLFRLDPERAHDVALNGLAAVHASPALQAAFAPAKPSPRLATRAFGIDFPAPLGMAAGFDKWGRVYNGLLALGFGHVEIGTVTPKAQPGNEGVRVQRFPEQAALVNRLGFPNPGLDEVQTRMARHPPIGIIGANVGPNKTTPPENVVDDIDEAAGKLSPQVRFVTINVSSPNTPGLRALQEPGAVSGLVARVIESVRQAPSKAPVLLKLHPDAPEEDLVRVGRAAVDAGAAAIIATNTTRERPPGTEGAIEGGLSGAPLRDRARRAIAALHHGLGRDTPIVGVGGIFTGEDALGHIEAGATILQGYTGFVYRGPRFPALLHDELVAALDAKGYDTADEAVGQG